MLVVSLADFAANPSKYAEPVQIENNGVTLGNFMPASTGFFARLFASLFAKKDDTVDGVHRPSRQLKAALREAKYMEKHPEKYKGYTDLDEMWADLNK